MLTEPVQCTKKSFINKHNQPTDISVQIIQCSTNLYSVQRKALLINTTSQEVEQFIGLHMYISIIDFPTYRMYWANGVRYSPIENTMSRNRYQKVNDISQKDDLENGGNKLYKI